MNLQINLAIGYTNFIGIMDQVHYIDNQFNLNFQSIVCCEQSHDLVPILLGEFPSNLRRNDMREKVG
jgi:hypothetical protein